MAELELVDVVCPEGVAEGESAHVCFADGREFDVVLPAGVSAGDTFRVELQADASLPTGLRAIAATIQEAREIAASFFGDAGSVPKPVEGGEVLAEALKAVLRSLEYIDELDELIDGNSAAFAEYTPDGEQHLEWTELFQQYVALVEQGISTEVALCCAIQLASAHRCSSLPV